MKHRVISMIMALLVIFTFMLSFDYKARAAELVNPAILTDVIPILAAGMVACGLTFATDEAIDDAVIDYLAYASESITADIGLMHTGLKPIYDMVTGSIKLIAIFGDTLWADMKSWVDATYDVGEATVSGSEEITYSEDSLTVLDVMGGVICTRVRMIRSSLYYMDTTVVPDGSGTYTCDTKLRYISGDGVHTNYGETYGVDEIHVTKNENVGIIDFMADGTTLNSNALSAVISFVVDAQTSAGTGIIGESGAIDNPDWGWSADGVNEDDRKIPFVPNLDNLWSGEDLIDSDYMKSEIQTLNPTTVMEMDVTGVPITSTEEISAEGIVDYSIVEEMALSAEGDTSLKALFFSKFPFCLPWDLYHAIELFSSQPEAPRFEVDFLAPIAHKIPFAGSTVITLDFSEYENLGAICRWISLLSFCLGLILLTRGLIRG